MMIQILLTAILRHMPGAAEAQATQPMDPVTESMAMADTCNCDTMSDWCVDEQASPVFTYECCKDSAGMQVPCCKEPTGKPIYDLNLCDCSCAVW